MEGDRPSILDLQDELHSTTWYRVYQHLQRLDSSIYAFEVNFLELLKVGKFLCNPQASSPLTRLMHHDILGRCLQEVIRLLHNYVAAAKSLVDHTRRCSRSIGGEGHPILDYQDRVDQFFSGDPLTHFVQDLRNYFLHYELADVAMTVSFSADGPTYTQVLTLSVETLARWDGWSAPARKYMEEAGETVDTVKAVELYRDRVREFCGWFHQSVLKLFESERNEYAEKEGRLLRLQLDMGLNIGTADGRAGTTEGEEAAFYGVFGTEEFRKLAELPPRSSERAALALELLKGRLELPQELEQRIRAWYQADTESGEQEAAQSD